MVEQWNSGTEMVEQLNRYGRTVQQPLWNRGTVMVEQRNSYGGTVEQ